MAFREAVATPTPPPASTRLSSIDGLRTLAVLAVLMFHIDETWLPGGYLGVDLFFVISGFVVTRSLLHKRPSYRTFLAGRFYRLVPSAAVTILATVLLFQLTGAGLLDRSHQGSAFFALVALSNMYFLMQNSYFDVALQGNPFLHFWSLSVEEQFYLIWPAAVATLVGFRMFGRALIVAALAALSFALFTLYPDQSFFFMPARAFQFALGALAYLVYARHSPKWSPLYLYGAVIACLIPLVLLNGTQPWLLNTLAVTALFTITVFCAAAAGNAGLLKVRPIQLIGGASYSIYLVHWPIIVYLNLLFPPTIAIQAAALAASLLMGIGLHNLVERPLNKPPIFPKRRSRYPAKEHASPMRFGAPALACCALIVTGALSWTSFASFNATEENTEMVASMVQSAEASLAAMLPKPVIPEPRESTPAPVMEIEPAAPVRALDMSNPEDRFEATRVARSAAIDKGVTCHTFETGRKQGTHPGSLLYADLNLGTCLNGTPLLLSDSTWSTAAKFLATTLNSYNLAQLNASGCWFTVSGQDGTDCRILNDKRIELLTREIAPQKDVYLAFQWSAMQQKDLHALLEFLGTTKRRIVLMTQLPVIGGSPAQLVSANANAKEDLTPWMRSPKDMQDMLRAADEKFSNIELLEWSPLDVAPVVVPALTPEGREIYKDGYHLTDDGQEWFIRQYLHRAASTADL